MSENNFKPLKNQLHFQDHLHWPQMIILVFYIKDTNFAHFLSNFLSILCESSASDRKSIQWLDPKTDNHRDKLYINSHAGKG